MAGFKFNNKHTNEFGLILLEREISPPSKNKIKSSVPFMNGSYDFSELYGEQSFGERTLKYKFDVSHYNHELLMYKLSELQNWLLGTGQEKLYDDDYKNLYFKAECTDISVIDDDYIGEIAITFTAYPFKISDYYEGNDIWDKFNFEIDVAQEVVFDISGSKDINLVNNGIIKVYPTIISDSEMEIIKDNITYKVSKGISNSWNFALNKGENKLTVKGNGNIEFKFKKELI